MRRWLPSAALVAAAFLNVGALPAGAQCVMCYRTAAAQSHARANVLDMGILILGAPPVVILAGFIAYVFKRGAAHDREMAAADRR